MGNNNELRIGQLQEQKMFSLIVNKYNDTIEIPIDDAGFTGRFIDLIKWIDEYEEIAIEKEKTIKEKFEGRELIKTNDDGSQEFDIEILDAINTFHLEVYGAIFERIEMVFGKDSLKKYFRMFYERTPEFIPDEDALTDFLEEIAPIINNLFDTKIEYKKKRKTKFDKYQKVYHK